MAHLGLTPQSINKFGTYAVRAKEEKEAAKLLEADIPLSTEDFDLRDLCGPGYAIPSKEGNEAVELMARLQGLFLDPVYTGKAFAGLLAMAREKQFRETDHVLFLHSGGAGGLFAVR